MVREDLRKTIAREILSQDIFNELINTTSEWQMCYDAIIRIVGKYALEGRIYGETKASKKKN